MASNGDTPAEGLTLAVTGMRKTATAFRKKAAAPSSSVTSRKHFHLVWRAPRTTTYNLKRDFSTEPPRRRRPRELPCSQTLPGYTRPPSRVPPAWQG